MTIAINCDIVRIMAIHEHIADLRNRLRNHRTCDICRKTKLTRPTVRAFVKGDYPPRIETVLALEIYLLGEAAADNARQDTVDKYNGNP